MTITQYFQNYKANSKFPFSVLTSNSTTIDDFYNTCICDKYTGTCIAAPYKTFVDSIVDWHDMLVKYAEDDSNIFWVRQYESGRHNSNENRRASLVQFADNFRILYVSNFDAQEILNMAITGVTPDLQEFKDLMNNHEYYFHYSDKCEEAKTNSYPNKLNARNMGVLTQAGFYLAHIRSINEDEYFIHGNKYVTQSKKNKVLHDRLFPYGTVADYRNGNPPYKDRVYKQNYSLNNDEKEIIKAHFLRFVDPLNFFPIPGEKNHLYEYNSGQNAYRNIGEFPLMISYMYDKTQVIFSKVNFSDFDNRTCFGAGTLPKNNPSQVVNVAVRAPKKYSSLSKNSKKNTSKKQNSSGKGSPKKNTTGRGKAAAKIQVVYTPANEAVFKGDLLKKKKARIKWIYSNGTIITQLWDAKNMGPNSSVRANIQSRPQWRDGSAKGLVRVEVEVI